MHSFLLSCKKSSRDSRRSNFFLFLHNFWFDFFFRRQSHGGRTTGSPSSTGTRKVTRLPLRTRAKTRKKWSQTWVHWREFHRSSFLSCLYLDFRPSNSVCGCSNKSLRPYKQSTNSFLSVLNSWSPAGTFARHVWIECAKTYFTDR